MAISMYLQDLPKVVCCEKDSLFVAVNLATIAAANWAYNSDTNNSCGLFWLIRCFFLLKENRSKPQFMCYG